MRGPRRIHPQVWALVDEARVEICQMRQLWEGISHLMSPHPTSRKTTGRTGFLSRVQVTPKRKQGVGQNTQSTLHVPVTQPRTENTEDKTSQAEGGRTGCVWQGAGVLTFQVCGSRLQQILILGDTCGFRRQYVHRRLEAFISYCSLLLSFFAWPAECSPSKVPLTSNST